MSGIGIVVAAHAPLASALCATAREILGDVVCDVRHLRWVEVQPRAGAAETFEDVSKVIAEADHGDGVLLLADLFGGSAANIALAYLGAHQVEVVTGANLPMVLEALSPRGEETLADLARRVADAAQQSVVVAGSLLAPSAPLSRRSAATA